MAKTEKNLRGKATRRAVSKNSGLNAKLKLSPEMSEFMGTDKASRAEITTEIWKHIKKFKLQEPTNTRHINPDETLESILGSSRFSMFSIGSKISEHVSK